MTDTIDSQVGEINFLMFLAPWIYVGEFAALIPK